MQETKDIPITINGRKLTTEEARKEIRRINGAEEIPDPDVGRAPTTAERIAAKCDELKAMLLEKNRKYGDSALNPCRVFSRANSVEQILVRIDDKLSRIQNRQNDDDEDAVMDLAGYLILLMIAKEIFKGK